MRERDLTEPEDEAGDDELSHDSEEEEEELRDFKTTLYLKKNRDYSGYNLFFQKVVIFEHSRNIDKTSL